jgi:hypothetical protein
MFERIGNSKTFWLGLAALVLGGLGMTNETVAGFLAAFSLPDPGTLVSGGLVLIGLRDALAKIEQASKS